MSLLQVALAWALSRPAVGGAILGARGRGKIGATLQSARSRLSAELLSACSAAAEESLLPVRGEVYELERDRDGVHGRIMRYNLQAMSGPPYADELEERAAELTRTERHGAVSSEAPEAAGVAAVVQARRRARQAREVAKEAARLRRTDGETPDVVRRAAAVERKMREAEARAEAESRRVPTSW